MNRTLVIAIACAMLGAAPTFYVTRAVYQRATLRAEARLSSALAAIQKERADLLAKNAALNDALMEVRNEKRDSIDRLAVDLGELGKRVSLCAHKSDVRVTLAPSGTIETVPGGQQRDLAEAVREFAEACAVGRDRDAVDHNALADWVRGHTSGGPSR